MTSATWCNVTIGQWILKRGSPASARAAPGYLKEMETLRSHQRPSGSDLLRLVPGRLYPALQMFLMDAQAEEPWI